MKRSWSARFSSDEALTTFERAELDKPGVATIAQSLDSSGRKVPWLTLERLGCDDSQLTRALVDELQLRRPRLFPFGDVPARGVVVLISEWDTVYGRALPRSFENAFTDAGGEPKRVWRFHYLRGLNGQIIGPMEKIEARMAKSAEPVDVFRQLLQSRAPTIDYGRTQVDYVDRLAAQLLATQTGNPEQRIEAIGVLGTDTTDKLLILQGLRKVFPCAQYLTTGLDAALFAPEHYQATRNLLVATGFDLQLSRDYQGSILPFRDSGQTAVYLATLRAAEFSKAANNPPTPLRTPAVFEIGRSGPTLLSPALSGRETADGLSSPPAQKSGQAQSIYWMSPMLAVVIVAASLVAHHGHLALRRSLTATHRAFQQIRHIGRRRDKWTMIERLLRRMIFDFPTWLLIAGALIFLYVAAWSPWIASRPGEEPFFLSEGIRTWPAIWLRALAVFLCTYYFWIIAWQFRLTLASGQRELSRLAPEGSQETTDPSCVTPCEAWKQFCRRSRGWRWKAIVIVSWLAYIGMAMLLFKNDAPAGTVRGIISPNWDRSVLKLAVFSMHFLIIFAVAHNLSCAFFVRKVAQWLRSPDIPETHRRPLHTALMRAIAQVTNAMTR